MSDIPTTWIRPTLTGTGFLPDTDVQQDGSMLVQGEARSVRVQMIAMCLGAVVALVPLSVVGVEFPYYVQIFIAIGLVWGAICLAFVPKLITERFGRKVTVDLEKNEVRITAAEDCTVIDGKRVIGLQLLKGPPGVGSYELNLVYRNDDGAIERAHLMAHAIRRYVLNAAESYHQALNWPVDESCATE